MECLKKKLINIIKCGTIKKTEYENLEQMCDDLVKFLKHYNLNRIHESLMNRT